MAPRNRTTKGELPDSRDSRLVEVGERIRKARLAKMLDQKTLGELVGVGEKTIGNWEKGIFSPYRHIRELATVLEVSESWIWSGENERVGEDALVRLLEEQNRTLRVLLDEVRLLPMRFEDRRRQDKGDIPS